MSQIWVPGLEGVMFSQDNTASPSSIKAEMISRAMDDRLYIFSAFSQIATARDWAALFMVLKDLNGAKYIKLASSREDSK